MDRLPDIRLPVWMNRGEPLTLAHASKTWWQRVHDWLTFPLAQIDVDTCDEELLSLLAYQRDVERFPGESLSLFRLRVKYAFVNAQDAGSMAGFDRIFARLQIGDLQQLERQFQYDWDVILLRINDVQLSRDNALMMRLVRQYGRTCRRYFFDVLNETPVTINHGAFDNDAGYWAARAIARPTSITAVPAALRLARGESVFVRVEVLPEDAEDRSWIITSAGGDIAGVTVVGGGVQITARDWGEADITLQTNDGGLRATIHVDVVDMAKFVVRIDSLDRALFSVVSDSDLTIDYGDGVDSVDFRSEYAAGTNFSGYRIYATRALTVGGTYTLTVKGTSAKYLTFYQGLTLFTVNALIELVKLSGTRDGISYLAGYYSPALEKIHPDAFDLPWCAVCDYAFYRSGLKTIPDDLFHRMPLLRTLVSTFGECKAVPAIPSGLLDKNPLITSLSGTFAYCSGVTVIPPGLFDSNPLVVTFYGTFRNSGVRAIPPGLFAGKSLVTSYSYAFYQCVGLESAPDGVFDDSPLNTNLSGVFYDDAALTGNLGDIFPLSQYAVTTLTSALNNCVGLTGSGVDFIGRMPLTSSHTAALRNCTGLDDYAELQTDFPGWV